MAMTAEQIADERARGRWAAAAAIGAAVVFPVGLFLTQVINRDSPGDNTPAVLRFFDSRTPELIGAAVLQALGMALIVVAAIHLYRATKARNPSLARVVRVMGVFGPLAFSLGVIVRAVALAFLSADFSGREFQTVDAADDVLRDPTLIIAGLLGFAGILALGFWFVMGSLHAMRVGLLSRFMGVLGIIVGPALVLGLAPIVMTFWLAALGALFLGLWPGGAPPAWEAGEAIPWTGARRPDREEPPGAPGGSGNGDAGAVGSDVYNAGTDAVGSPPVPARRRRKRKRRR